MNRSVTIPTGRDVYPYVYFYQYFLIQCSSVAKAKLNKTKNKQNHPRNSFKIIYSMLGFFPDVIFLLDCIQLYLHNLVFVVLWNHEIRTRFSYHLNRPWWQEGKTINLFSFETFSQSQNSCLFAVHPGFSPSRE